jgi:capsular polysaccharide biosynthesis protein
MELMLIIRILLRRWWLVVIPVAVVAVVTVPDLLSSRSAVSDGYSTVIRYSAAQKFNLPDRDGDYQDVWLASELTVNALTAWVRTSSFKDEIALAAADLGLETDLGALGVSSDNARSIGQIFLSWPDEAQLRIIAQAALDVLQNRTQDYFPQLGAEPAQVTILDDVVISSAPPPITDRFAPLIKLALGIVAGLGLAFLVEYLDTTIRDRQEVERLGLPVIVTIPRHRR